MDKKAFLAIGLCIGIFLLWIFVIVPWMYPPRPRPALQDDPSPVSAPGKPEEKPPATPPAPEGGGGGAG